MLPKIPYSMEKNKSMTVPIGNLNLSSNFKAGDIADSYGISARRYPQLANSKDKELVYEGGEILGMTVFNGEIVTVRQRIKTVSNGKRQRFVYLYIGDEMVYSFGRRTQSAPVGERRFAVLNTKLVVYPEKIYLEKVDGEWTVGNLEAELVAENVRIANDSIEVGLTSNNAFVNGKSGVFDAENRSFSPKHITLKCPHLCLYAKKEGDGEAGFSTYKAIRGGDILGTELDFELREFYVYVSGEVDFSGVFNGASAVLKHNDDIWEQSLAKIVKTDHTEYGSGVYKLTLNDVIEEEVSFIALEWWYNESINTFIQDAKKCQISANLLSDGSEKVLSGSAGSVVTDMNGDYFAIDNYTGEFREWYYDVTITYSAWDDDPFATIEIGDVVSFGGSTANTGTYNIAGKDNDTLYFEEDIVDEDLFGKIKIYKLSDDSQDALGVFKVGDGVALSCPGSAYDGVSFVISKIGPSSIHTSAHIFTTEELVDSVTITRKIPNLDFICEKDNRLYGVNNSEKTIYVSALGDPTNMYAYEGISTDSYAVAVGGEGDFTGCCKYAESVLFFKEDKIYKLTGYIPADFAIDSYDVDGVEKGSERSLVVINEVLYYKGKNGVFAYTGGIPSLISENFGEREFSDAAGGSDGVCYYLAAKDEKGVDKLLSFNTRLGLWVLENSGGDEIIGFAKTSAGLHYATSDGEVYKLHGSENVAENWMVQFVPFYETIEGKKTYSRLLMRAELPKGSYMIIEVRSDDGPWREAGKIVGANKGIIPIRLPIARCDKFEIRLRGKGEFVLHDILREYHVGSEV